MSTDLMEAQRIIGQHKHARLTYLFGSYATGKQGPLSDMDIAVFLDPKLSKSERFRVKLDLIIVLSSSLRTDRLDLVVMNDSPSNLNYEIIKHGRAIYVRHTGEKVDVESKIISDYLDRRYYERRDLDTFLKNILERGRL